MLMLTWAGLLLRGFPQDLRLLGAERLQTSQLLRQLRVGQSQIHPFGGEEESVRDAVPSAKCLFVLTISSFVRNVMKITGEPR